MGHGGARSVYGARNIHVTKSQSKESKFWMIELSCSLSQKLGMFGSEARSVEFDGRQAPHLDNCPQSNLHQPADADPPDAPGSYGMKN
jgi:hypothetical protein